MVDAHLQYQIDKKMDEEIILAMFDPCNVNPGKSSDNGIINSTARPPYQQLHSNMPSEDALSRHRLWPLVDEM